MSRNFPTLPYFLQSLLLPPSLKLILPFSLFYLLSMLLLIDYPHNYILPLYNNNSRLVMLHQNLAFPLIIPLLLFHNCSLLHVNLLIPHPLAPLHKTHLNFPNPLLFLNLYNLLHHLTLLYPDQKTPIPCV